MSPETSNIYSPQNNIRMFINMRPLVQYMLTSLLLMFLALPQAVGQNNDSLILAKESQHFDFYSTNDDIKVLDSLATALEKNYSRITTRLGVKIENKIKVKVFPNVKAFHDAINYPGAPDWVVGTWNTEGLMMVSPLNPGSSHTYESLMQVIVHEFVHIAVFHALGGTGMAKLPKWLSEGYAMYESGQINEPVRKSVKSSLMQKAPPTWTQLDEVSMMEFGSMNGYGFSGAIVEFLVDTYGIDKLALLIKQPENIEMIYGLPKDALEKQWVLYLKE
jgi:hypothetical protein